MRNYNFGNFLRDLRTKKNLSQSELGEIVGVTNKAVSKWENGAAYPSTELIAPLSAALGISVEEMLNTINQAKSEKGKTRKFLDLLLLPSKIRLIVIAVIWVVLYVVFAMFSDTEEKNTLMIAVPVTSLIVFVFFYFLVWFQTKNPMCRAVWLDIFLICAFVFFILGWLALLFQFAINPKDYTFSLHASLSVLASIVASHSKRV